MKKIKMIALAMATILAFSCFSGCANDEKEIEGKSKVRGEAATASGWGVDLKISGGLYTGSYSYDYTSVTYEADHDADGKNGIRIKVEDKDLDENGKHSFVAPGTNSDKGLNISFTGEPTTDYQLEVSMETENMYLTEGTYGIMVKVDSGIINSDNFYDISAAEYLYVEENGVFNVVDEFLPNATYYTLEDKVENDSIYYPVIYNISSYVESDIATDFTEEEYLQNEDTLNEISKIIFKKITGKDANEGAYTVEDGKIIWNSFTSEIFESGSSIASNIGLSDVNLNWNWNWEFTDDIDAEVDVYVYDMLDTILVNLQYNSDTPYVVKLQNDGTYKEPIETVDYNLESSFMLDVTVKKVG